MMKIKILHIGILLFFFIAGCGSDSNTSISPPTSGNCPNGQSLGCDDNCSLSPSEFDVCGVCGGDGSSCEGLWNIFYDVGVPIAGFQFDVDGAIVAGASGGAAADAGFTISAGNTTILAFSFTGTTIPAGSGVLVQVEIDGDANSACLTAPIISDTSGVALDIEFTCDKIEY
tara:strand:+ start:55 stop:570 length:516 start_codon:yes stop_codon:yes gene_type:complete